MLVSLIIPCYNAQQWLSETIDSLLAQTYRPIEIIIIDDGSTDGSLKIIRQYADLFPDLIRYETGPNRGASAARNRGLELSRGDFIVFYDADDLMEPITVAAQVEYLKEYPGQIAASPWWSIELVDGIWKRFDHKYSDIADPIMAELSGRNYIPGTALMWPREIIVGLGGWDVEVNGPNDDGELRMRARLSGYTIGWAHSGGVIWRKHTGARHSTNRSYQSMLSVILVVEKIERTLRSQGRLAPYRLALARQFHRLASSIMPINEELGERALQNAIRLGGVRSVSGNLRHSLLCYTIGMKRKERLVRWMKVHRLTVLLGRSRR